jgi:signal transduction histidine kinase
VTAPSREVALFEEQRDANYRRCSRLFSVLMVGQWIFGLFIALVFSPYGWEGKERAVHAHVWVALFLGAGISSLPLFLTITQPTAPVTRHVVAVGQMLWSALLIHLTGGRIETHFHVFGSLAFLAFYRDWKILLPATVVVATDHLARQMFWPESVYGLTNPEWWRFLEHAFWVVFEDTVLIAACLIATEEMRTVAAARAEAEALSVREQEKSRELQRALDELESSQGALVRAEKLAAVGQLAASVGHELRNPLAAVRNANAYIAKKVKQQQNGDPRVEQFAQLVEKELDVCAKIIGDLLDFARERPLVLAPTPLRDLVEEAINLVPPSKVQIVNAIAGDLPIPVVDKEQFRQVIINITQNAVEATGDHRDDGRVTLRAEKRDGGMFRLVVEDDGPGIPEEVIAKMFEPLFTTKVKGTGLGLAIVSGIIKRHQGTISVHSKVGKGTRFTIDWPGQLAARETTRVRSNDLRQPTTSPGGTPAIQESK